MKIETLEVAGLAPAIHAMRNPYDSWGKSDSTYVWKTQACESSDIILGDASEFLVGDADRELSMKLAAAGPEHAKHLRMVMVWAEIKAPRYWWMEFDTYRAGVEKVSCSTMHTLMKRDLTPEDFEHDCVLDANMEYWLNLINNSMRFYRGEIFGEKTEEEKKQLWRGIIQGLPQGYLQERTVMMSYAALRGICRQRKGHKLKEWAQFREWCEGLPESWMITE